MKTSLTNLRHLSLLAATALWLTAPGSVTPLEAAELPFLTTTDKVSGITGTFRGGSDFTPPGGGRTGTAGDRAVDFGPTGSGPVHIANASFLNEAAVNDEMTWTLWVKKTDDAPTDNSVFWAVSPSTGEGRGWQAHLPWSNQRIYFDTAGCCNPDQRIDDEIHTWWPDYEGYTWWQRWHFWVFSKKGEVKEVWIDGQPFLPNDVVPGAPAAPLPADFTELFLGSNGGGGGLFRGMIDDLAVFGTALTEAQIGQLYTGTAPTALPAAAKLLAYWDFNDYPTTGYLVSLTPEPGATHARPDLIEIVRVEGTPAWNQGSVTLKVDGVTVTPTFTPDGDRLSIRYTPDLLFAPRSTHTVALTYPLSGGASETFEWAFTVGAYTLDLVESRLGIFRGGSTFTPGGGGRTGAASDHAVEFGAGTGPVHIADAGFLNQAAANDEMTFAVWAKKPAIENNSVFWAVSPSSGAGQRGWQVHLPWSNNQIYFDTVGCCNADQRINLPLEGFPGYTDLGWWNQWRSYVFTKQAGLKQIWIDGVLFHEGDGAAALPTDFTELFLGAEPPAANLFRGQIDDFAVFRTALTPAQIGQLAAGTSPQALPESAGLLAYWNFDDMPPEGLFVSFTPEPDSTDALPNLIRVVHAAGIPPWDTSKVSLLVDGSPVTATVVQADGFTTVSYVPSPIFAPGSHHQATLLYPAPDGTMLSHDWAFTVGAYTKDRLHSHLGFLTGTAVFTSDGGGRTGQPGDYGIDFGRVNARQGVLISDAGWLNEAAAVDAFAVAGWQKFHAVADSAFFWAVSPSSTGGQRGIGTHTPWSNNILYFDTAGCCDAVTQRMNQSITEFPNYSGELSWWQDWHHFVFQKDGEVKQIWIDGILFHEAINTAPLPEDLTTAWFGYNPVDNGGLQGILDDMALFGAALSETQVGQLAAGNSPESLPATARLLAFWDFNDASLPAPPELGISLSQDTLTVTWTTGGTLQHAESITGPWADVPGSPAGTYTGTVTGTTRYFRVK